MRKNYFYYISLMLVILVSQSFSQPEYPRVSPGASVSQMIGITKVSVEYHRPGVKGRLIWGEIVPFEKLWRAGANNATTVEFSTEVVVKGTKVPAGKYSYFILIEESTKVATLVINKEADLWGTSGYKEEEDVLRVSVKPEYLEHQEWLIYTFTNIRKDFANLSMHWEDFSVSLPINVETDRLVLEGARKAEGWREKMNAARYCLENDVAMDEGVKWINESVSEQRNFSNLSIQAQILNKEGNGDEAIKVMEEAIAKGKAMEKKPFYLGAMEKMLKEWKK